MVKTSKCCCLQILAPHEETSVLSQLADLPDAAQIDGAVGEFGYHCCTERFASACVQSLCKCHVCQCTMLVCYGGPGGYLLVL